MDYTGAPMRHILWVDDEIDLLKPHLLVLEDKGYRVDAITNGDDALILIERNNYDLLLLDEQMPGRSGLEILDLVRKNNLRSRVVMVTKSEEDITMKEAIGRRADDYLLKPVSPLQVLSAVTRVLEGSSIRQEHIVRDFAEQFPVLSQNLDKARTESDFAKLYMELTDWHVRLEYSDEKGLLDSVQALLANLRKDFGLWIKSEYPKWMRGSGSDKPILSVDVIKRHLVPMLDGSSVMFVLLDCLRMDQWKVIAPLLVPYFEIDESYHYSILPTATPYCRNAIFSGSFPDSLYKDYGYRIDNLVEGASPNDFEDELLSTHLQDLCGGAIPVHYEKITSDLEGSRVRARVRSALKQQGSVVAAVFNFVDMMTHGRSDSAILMEVARDEAALRNVTRSWFERSTAFSIIKDAAEAGHRILLTSDHGSILCKSPTTIYANKDVTSSLRYKIGRDLRLDDPATSFLTKSSEDMRLPPAPMGTSYALALDDHYFVYQNRLREYQRRYRNSFLHGGISPEEMIVPVVGLKSRKDLPIKGG